MSIKTKLATPGHKFAKKGQKEVGSWKFKKSGQDTFQPHTYFSDKIQNCPTENSWWPIFSVKMSCQQTRLSTTWWGRRHLHMSYAERGSTQTLWVWTDATKKQRIHLHALHLVSHRLRCSGLTNVDTRQNGINAQACALIRRLSDDNSCRPN